MTATDKVISVKDGPSREELFDALRLWNEHREVVFSLEVEPGKRTKFYARILCISVEDGSGHSWNILVSFQKSIYAGRTAELYYHDQNRSGSMSAEYLTL